MMTTKQRLFFCWQLIVGAINFVTIVAAACLVIWLLGTGWNVVYARFTWIEIVCVTLTCVGIVGWFTYYFSIRSEIGQSSFHRLFDETERVAKTIVTDEVNVERTTRISIGASRTSRA